MSCLRVLGIRKIRFFAGEAELRAYTIREDVRGSLLRLSRRQNSMTESRMQLGVMGEVHPDVAENSTEWTA